MKLQEYRSKEILARHGVPTQEVGAVLSGMFGLGLILFREQAETGFFGGAFFIFGVAVGQFVPAERAHALHALRGEGKLPGLAGVLVYLADDD